VKGCLEPDITALLEVFAREIEQVNAALETLIKLPDQFVRITELPTVIDKLEVIVDSDLGTLHTFLKEKNLIQLNLKTLYDNVLLWSEDVWLERKALALKQKQEEEEAELAALQPYGGDENSADDMWDEQPIRPLPAREIEDMRN